MSEQVVSAVPGGGFVGGVAACILLAGGLKSSPLLAESGGSILDLYLSPRSTVLSMWLDRFQQLASVIGYVPPVHVVHGSKDLPQLESEAAKRGISIVVDQDRQQYRGPAGAVRDACDKVTGEGSILVAEAARYISADLNPMVVEHLAQGADMTVACNPDNSPAGVFLIKRQSLDLVPPIGFMDLKEQWLGKAVEAGRDVRVHRLRAGNQRSSYELRTREGFLQAAEAAGGLLSTILAASNGVHAQATLMGEGCFIGEGCSIGPGAVIVESVIMPGAQVGAGALVARSVVCAGGQVNRDAIVVDAVVPSMAGRSAAANGRAQEVRR